MVFGEAVTWTKANRPEVAEGLIRDIDALSEGIGPDPDHLARAPLLDHWLPVVARNLVFLSGIVVGHPCLPNGRHYSSALCAIDPATFKWARTGSRFYRLGRNFGMFQLGSGDDGSV